MSDRYRQAKRALCGIYQEIFEYAYDHYSLPREWHDGDVLITKKPESARFAPGRLTIVTPGAREIAWLLNRLRDALGSLSNGAAGADFFQRLAHLIKAHELTAVRPYRVNSILKSVMEEAFTMLEELEERERQRPSSIADRQLAMV